MEIPTAIITLIIGFFLLFFGYRVKKIAITIIWFVIGFWLVSLFVNKITDNQIWQLILECVGGLVLGMFGMTIEKFAVFITVGAAFGWSIIENFGPVTDWTLPAIVVAVGVVAGVIGVWLIKPMIIFATSIQGATLIAASVLVLLNIDKPEWYSVLTIAVAAIGAIFQWNSCRNIE